MGLGFMVGDDPDTALMCAANWPYSEFGRFRERLAKEAGIDLAVMDGFDPGGTPWDTVDDPLVPLLNHSDCDGEIAASVCAAMEPRLRDLVNRWPDGDDDRVNGSALADAMQCAAHLGEPLVFV